LRLGYSHRTMVIGVLGKGGVGKSTVASQLALYFTTRGKSVLGIDADYNMDFVFNVTGGVVPESIPYFGTSKKEMKEYVGVDIASLYGEGVLGIAEQKFMFSPECMDLFTAKYSTLVKENLSMIVCGPETDEVLHGIACGHSLSAPLKLYLPLLEVGKDSIVILDEKAGADGANTGIISGCDLVLIVTDPSLHGTKTALQIAKLAEFFEVPYYFVGNKVHSEADTTYIRSVLGTEKLFVFNNDQSIARAPNELSTQNNEFFVNIHNDIESKANNELRLERSRKKFRAEQEFR